MFSATLTSAKMDELIKLGLRNPIVIKLSKKKKGTKELEANGNGNLDEISKEQEKNRLVVPEKLVNYYKLCSNRSQKIYFLINYLEKNPSNKTIIFFNTCASVVYYFKLLGEYFMKNGKGNITKHMHMIHGEMKQQKR